MRMLSPLLNRKSDLSVRNGVLLYKQLIRPMMNYACHVWRSAARAHVRRLQVLQSMCIRLSTGPLGTQRAGTRGSGCSVVNPTTSMPWLQASTQIYLMCGIPY
jgi:hypothetical protein